MQFIKAILGLMPKWVITLTRPLMKALGIKHMYEHFYWKTGFKKYGEVLENDRYEPIMLAMAEEENDGFLSGKIVADFGCGPRGSLSWAKSAQIRIGIDVLVDRYADSFSDVMKTHDMIYVKSTEKVIPIPSDFVDVMFTMNAIDHVDDFPTMCAEVLRVLKPEGYLIGSFNLGEPLSFAEPQTLSVQDVQTHLLDRLQVESYRISRQGDEPDNEYAPFFEGNMSYEEGEEAFLWVKAKKV
jgi:ubiquinone/menaquinone biosynthesis C-methylase UbiE